MCSLFRTLALLLLLGVAGCIGDGTDECPQVNLVFRYEADGAENVIGNHIREAALYLFDREGNPVMERKLSAKELKSNQGIRLFLPAKAYRLVCWGNATEQSQIRLGNKLDESVIRHAYADEADKIRTFDPLYYASCGIEALPEEGNTVEVKFHSAHVRMEIHVYGFAKRYGINETPLLRITGLDGQYDFDMKRSGMLACSPEGDGDEANQVHAFLANVLRFEENSPVGISLYQSQSKHEVFRLRMDELFRDFRLVFGNTLVFPLDREEAVVAITIDFSGTEVEVNIVPPAWEEKPVAPGI